MKKIALSALLLCMALLAACGAPAASSVGVIGGIPGTSSETAPVAAQAESMIAGTILDATMNTLQIKTPDGKTLLFTTEEADKTAAQGLTLGSDVRVFYTGTLTGEDTKGVKVIRLEQEGEQMIEGKILDAAMNTLEIETADGQKMLFDTEDADKTAAQGLLIGGTVKVYYIVPLTGDEAGALKVTRIEQDAEQMLEGSILDASMNTLQIKTDDGMTLLFSTEKANKTAAEGLLIGSRVKVYYSGSINGNDTSAATVLRLEQEPAPSLTGVVTDASMNVVTIKTDDGKETTFSLVDADLSSIVALALGSELEIFYEGDLSTDSAAPTAATRVVQNLSELEGIVLEASMNVVTIKADDGKTYVFSTNEVDPGNIDGVRIDARVRVAYVGEAIGDGETVNMGVVSVEKA